LQLATLLPSPKQKRHLRAMLNQHDAQKAARKKRCSNTATTSLVRLFLNDATMAHGQIRNLKANASQLSIKIKKFRRRLRHRDTAM
jgi:hypothetical protein